METTQMGQIPKWFYKQPLEGLGYDPGSPDLGDIDAEDALDFEKEEKEYIHRKDRPDYIPPALHERNLRLLCTALKKRVKGNLDAVVCISGEEGSGKSHLALRMAKLLAKDFDFEKHVIAVPTYEKVKDKVFSLPKYSPLVLDEAIKTMYKRDFAKSSNKLMNQMFNLCRKKNLIFFLCLPRFSDLDPYFRDHRVLLSIVIPSYLDTGVAVVHRRDDNPYNTGEKWHLKDSYDLTGGNKKKKLRFDQYRDTIDRVSAMARTPNYLMTIRYDYDAALDAEYEQFLKRHNIELENFDESVTTKDQITEMRLEKAIMLMAVSGIDKELMAKGLEIPKAQITKLLNQKSISNSDILRGKLKAQLKEGIVVDFDEHDAVRDKYLEKEANMIKLIQKAEKAKFEKELKKKPQKPSIPLDEKALKVKELFS